MRRPSAAPQSGGSAPPLASIDVTSTRKAVRDLVDWCLSDSPPSDFLAQGTGASARGSSLSRRLLARRLLEPYVTEAYHMSVARAVRAIVRKHDGTPRGAVEACIADRDAAGRRRFALASAGQGAYGKVYRLDKKRAAKLVLIEGRGFEREADLARRAAEMGIAPAFYSVVSCCSADTGVCYAIIVMEALDITLGDWLRSPAAYSLEKRERMRDAVAAKLRRMHRAGIFHNDLHSDNIMIREKTGEPFIIDWGLAREGAEESHNDRRVLQEILPSRWLDLDQGGGHAGRLAVAVNLMGSARSAASRSGSAADERDAETLHHLVSFVVKRLGTRVAAFER